MIMKPLKKTILAAVSLSLFAALAVSLFYYMNTVAIISGGAKTRARCQDTTVKEFLEFHGIEVSSRDIVTPSLEDRVPRHGTINVIRVTEKTEQIRESSPFIIRWGQKDYRNLRPVELQKGSQRIKIKSVKTIYHDGKAVSKEILRERTTTKTVYRLALLNKNGSWECLYDLSKSKKIRMTATAYYPGDPLAWRDGKVTFLGQKMQRGIVAVDPDVIPLKTRVYVSGYGYGWAGDTGSVIKRKRIDLGLNNKSEEKYYMHVPVTVYLLEKADTW